MIFITGGCCQGKLEFAKGLSRNKINKNQEIVVVDGATANFGDLDKALIVNHLEEFIKRIVEEKTQLYINPESFVEKLMDNNNNIIIILTDIGYGIVNTDIKIREICEYSGRCGQLIAKLASEVYTLRAGIAIRIK